jgi:uncharacterized protein
MKDEDRLVRLRTIARDRTPGGDPAHDFSHVERVAALARSFAVAERGDPSIAEAAALLHELFSLPKHHPDSSRSGELCAERAIDVLRAEAWDTDRIDAVAYCIRVHGFSRGISPETLEARVVQDADRLDAIGAVGVARCFATSQAMRGALYHAADPFARFGRALDDRSFAVDHFFRKLLLIEGQLHTEAARVLAASRTRFMREFLTQLESELQDSRAPDGPPASSRR